MRLLLLLLLTQPAAAGKRDKATEAAPSGPTVEEVLEAAGWTITPERSSMYAAGDIYDGVSNSKVATREQCFAAIPEEGVYTSLQVVQAMKASANVRLGVVKLSGGGMQYKQRTFAEPYVSELPLLSQQLTEQCAGQLRSLDVSSMHVLTAVLSAEVKEENCTTVEGGAQVVGVASGELGVSQQCKEESAGHVAVAYKTRPVSELLGGSGRVSVPAGGGPAVGAGGGGSGGAFDGVGDLAAQLAAAEALKTKLEGELSTCLDGEAAKVASSARSDWAKLGELRTLASSSADAHAATVPQVERFVSVYGDREVTCRNDLGERSRRVTPSEVDEARAWLEQPAPGGDWVGASGYRMVSLPAGTFTMGSPSSEPGRDDDESQHLVTLTRGFLLGETEVTQRLWRSVMGENPASTRQMYWGGKEQGACNAAGSVSLVGDAYPVMCVDWCDAVAFANVLSRRDGLSAAYSGTERCAETKGASVEWRRGADGYRLPTESEWEYAARAGDHRLYAGAESEGAACRVGNVGDASAKALFPSWETFSCDDGVAGLADVGRYAANAWGLHDMTGNALEWTWDWYGDYPRGSATDSAGPQSGAYRVHRGGSWSSAPRYARVAYRNWNAPDYRSYRLGLRLARTSP